MAVSRTLTCLLLIAAGLAPRLASADAVVEHRKQVHSPAVDPAVVEVVHRLLGARAPAQAQGAARSAPDPSWLLSWRRTLEAATRGEGSLTRADGSEVSGVRVLELDLREGGQLDRAARDVSWAELACGAARPETWRALQVRPLRATATGDHLLMVELSCAASGTARRSRLLVRTQSQGAVLDAWGLSVQTLLSKATARPSRGEQLPWPVRPAALEPRFRWLLQLAGNRWIAQIGLELALPARPSGGQDLSALPGAVAWHAAADLPAPRAALALDALGRPTRLLFSGAATLRASPRQAGQRRAHELRLPPPVPTARLAAVDRIGLWEVARPKGAILLLQQVAAQTQAEAGASIFTDAGVRAWQVDAHGDVRPLEVELPRTHAEGLWACDASLEDKQGLRCHFDASGLPGALVFAPRQLRLGADRVAREDPRR